MSLLIPFVAIIGFLVGAAYILENRHPRIDRLAYPQRHWEQRVAGFVVFGLALFVVVAAWGQGTPA